MAIEKIDILDKGLMISKFWCDNWGGGSNEQNQRYPHFSTNFIIVEAFVLGKNNSPNGGALKAHV